MTSQGFRILVVDDLLDNLLLLQIALEAEGYTVEVASDGYIALDKIQTSLPDLMLLDVMMPGIDGYELTQIIRQELGLKRIPILLVSAHSEASATKGFEVGANGFIRKPIDFSELMTQIKILRS